MIYRIHPITKKYLSLHMEGKEARRALGEETDFNIDPSPISYLHNWKSMKVDFYDGDDGADTIPDISMRVGKLFLSQRAYMALEKALQPHGEFLPVTYAKGDAFIFNCLEMAESHHAVNDKLSMHDPLNNRFSLIFDENKLSCVNIFRCNLDLDGFFCTDTVKEIIVREELTGVEFSIDTGHPFPPDTGMQIQH